MPRLVPLLAAVALTAAAAPGQPDKPPPDPKGAAPAYAGRTGEAREKLLKDGGGTEATEEAVARGLAWLAKQQKADGSWAFDGKSPDHAAATGMALLPFLAAGETPKGKGKYAKAVAGGLGYLVKNCPPAGKTAGMMSENMYAQGIAALALCEAYGMTKDKALLPPAQAAVNCVQRAQGPNGSWGYSAKTPNNGDTSITGWQVQVLRAAQLGKDLKVDPKVLQKAVAFLDSAAKGERKAEYGYADSNAARPGTALTAVGLWCRHHADGWGPDNPGMQDGVAGLAKRGPAGNALDTYYLYYAAQVVRDFGGDEWRDWNEGKKGDDGPRKGGMRDVLVDLQVRKDGPNLGSWNPDTGLIGNQCGRIGTTALCVLTLEVYYRHAPAGAGDGKK